jgi:hypothetical protein
MDQEAAALQPGVRGGAAPDDVGDQRSGDVGQANRSAQLASDAEAAPG